MKSMKKTQVVIIGGGFGGVYTARNLCKIFKKEEIDIVLINKANYFLFTPLLHEVATGGLTPDSVIESIREIFRGTCVTIVEDTVTEINKIEKKVKTSAGSFSYDFLVVSTGSETNYFGTVGAREHSFTLKDLPDAIALRNHILETCETAVKTKNKDLLVTSIIGAGPTGVELAAELVEYMRHTLCVYYKNSGFKKEDIKVNLMTMSAEIIPQFPKEMRDIATEALIEKGVNVMTNTMVERIESNTVVFKDGSNLKSHTIVWVAGVASTVSEIKGTSDIFSFFANKRVEINRFLQSTKTPEVFALGDIAGSSPMLAQIAVQQARVVAENIHSSVNNLPLLEFIFKEKGLLISVGQWYAIGGFGKDASALTLKGNIMWLIWRAVYLFNFLSWRKRFEILSEWTSNLFSPRDITYLK